MFCEWLMAGAAGVSGLLFIVFCSVFFVAACAASENDDNWGYSAGVAVWFFVIWLFLGNLVQVLKPLGWHLVWCPFGWLAVGGLWSLPRWIIFLKRAKRAYLAAYANWTARTDKDKESWLKSYEYREVARQYGFDYDEKVHGSSLGPIPYFEKNRGRLVNWILLWPVSMFWTMLRDGLKQLADAIVDHLGKTYQRLSAWVFQGV
jgi:hypothetical protein